MYKYGHWISKVKINPDEYFGFVYLIHCLINGKKYIPNCPEGMFAPVIQYNLEYTS